MKTTDVENMGATALYEDQKKVIEAIRDEPDLPERYVQARLDALTRDVKLAEQAVTLDALQTGLEQAKQNAVTQGELSSEILGQRDEARVIIEGLQADSKDRDEKNKAAVATLDDAYTARRTADLADLQKLTEQKQADAIEFERRIQFLLDRCTRLSAHAELTSTAMRTVQAEATTAIGEMGATMTAALGEMAASMTEALDAEAFTKANEGE